jgi:hypothetical protein
MRDTMRTLSMLFAAALTCAALALVAAPARAELVAYEVSTDYETKFILNVSVSLQKIPTPVDPIEVFCRLRAGSEAVRGPNRGGKNRDVSGGFSREIGVPYSTGAASQTITLRLAVFDRSGKPYTGPLTATCELGLVVGPPPDPAAPKIGAYNVKPGAVLEVSGTFPP